MNYASYRRDDIVRNIDHHSAYYSNNWEEEFKIRRDVAPVAWSEHHGGYWILARHEDIAAACRDSQTFTSSQWISEDGRVVGGASIPTGPFPLIPLETDRPDWDVYRRLLNPWFAPGAIKRRVAEIERHATILIDDFIESGQVDLVRDLASPLPAMISLDILGISKEEWRRYANIFHLMAYAVPGSDEHAFGTAEMTWLFDHVDDHIKIYRRAPRNNIISDLISVKVGDRYLLDEEIGRIIVNLLGAGVDTTTSLTSNVLMYLHIHPEIREFLISDQCPWAVAREEFIRYFSPIHSMARTVQNDIVIRGQKLRRGDRVLLPFGSANRDETIFDCADQIRLDRKSNSHLGFGAGIHRCLGANMARTIFDVIVKQILSRIPDYRVIGSEAQRYPSIGQVNGWISIPAIFTPGNRQDR